MDRDIQHQMRAALEAVEKTLHENAGVPDIAAESSYSPFHFQRRFSAMTGISVASYIRRRKLTRAAIDLCCYDRRVIYCAFEYGFAHEQSFIRAFTREFGVSPGAFRREKVNIALQRDLSRDYIDARSGILISPFDAYSINHGIRIVGIRRRF
ncbi:MAG TPA: helix-turn-helix transcriptional regulator, partial [Spirochaetota bacterium]|nr:helix-turn-helix transcriptional regulator [Spirochaetota bacterium]